MAESTYKQLGFKIALTIIIFSVIPLLLLGAVLYNHFSNQYQQKMMENFRTLAENRRGAINLFFDERISQLVTLANTSTFEEVKDEAYVRKAFEVMEKRSKTFLDLGVINQEGIHLTYIGPYGKLLKEVNYKNEDWFNSVMHTGEYVSDIFLGFRKIPHFIIAVLVRDKHEDWILRATINSDILQDIVEAAQLGKSGDAYIINRNNILQTKPRFGGEVMDKAPGPDFSKTMNLTIEMVDVNGSKKLFAAVPIRSKQWVLVLKEDPREPLAPLLQAKYIVILLGLMGAFSIVGVALYTSRKLVNQLQLSDQKKAASDEMLMQSSKMAALGKMAAGIAHEINNPLAVIAEKAGWLKDLLAEEDVSTSPNLKEFDETVSKIEYHVDRAKKVTHRLLGFARRMEPVTEKVDINKVLKETIGFLENEARFLNINLRTDFDANLPLIISDTTQLQQVFLNLMNNAIDAIGKDGEIKIQTQFLAQLKKISIDIADNGPGIPKEILAKIFDPFFTTKEVGKGTGLGLSISYTIIEKLGGQIKVASEVGKGTTFNILLPVTELA